MRDKNQNYIQLNKDLTTYLEKKLPSTVNKVLREPVAISPTFLEERFRLRFSSNRLNSLRSVALISYYLPEILGWKIRLELWDYSRKLSPKDQVKLKLLLNTKDEAVLFFSKTLEFHSNEFWGSFLKLGLLQLETLSYYEIPYRLNRPQRKRGYNDKGSCTLAHRWVESDLGWEGRTLQKDIEKKRTTSKQLYLRIRKYLREILDNN